MKRFWVFPVLLGAISTAAVAAQLGACIDGTLSTYIGNSCTIGDKMFDSFTYTGNIGAGSVNIQFQAVGTESHLILAPVLGAGLFQTFAFTNNISVLAGVARTYRRRIFRSSP